MGLRRAGAITALFAAFLPLQPAGAQADQAPGKVSFYFAAHEDDWQLFMNPSAFQDVMDSRTKTVFVHTTAGDAGLGLGGGGRKHPYYLAREGGAETAIRFMADTRGYPDGSRAAPATFHGHAVRRVSYRNTVAYFLRLPDGHGGGGGFPGTGHQSLERLASGDIATLTPIDGSTIIDHERGLAPAVELNVAELDPVLNPFDHSDHRMTARAALDAAAALPCASRRHFVEYASARLPANLSAQERDMESSVVAVTAAGILALDHGSIWRPYYQTYIGRNYFRAEPGTGPCRGPAPEIANARSLTR